MFCRRNEVAIHGIAATDSAASALKVAADLLIPNVEQLLRIACVLPVTSCEAERSFSRMKLIKSNLRSTMTTQRSVFVLLCSIYFSIFMIEL